MTDFGTCQHLVGYARGRKVDNPGMYTFHSLQFILHILHSILYTLPFTLTHYTYYTLHSTHFTLTHYTYYTLHSTHYTHYALYVLSLYTYPLHTLHITLYTTHTMLYTLFRYTPYPLHTLHTYCTHFTLYTLHTTLRSLRSTATQALQTKCGVFICFFFFNLIIYHRDRSVVGARDHPKAALHRKGGRLLVCHDLLRARHQADALQRHCLLVQS